MPGPRLLILDVETSPLVGYSFGIWNTNINAMNQIVEHPRMLCFGARFVGEKKIHFASEYHDGRRPMLEQLHALLDETDFVVGWNSARFDRPWIDGEFDKEGLGPTAPSADIDLMRVAKKQFRLISYKLDYVAQHHYGLPGKVAHQGFTLWSDAIHGDELTQARAWKKMKAYQLGDIRVTEAVFHRMKPWIRLLPNPSLYSDDVPVDSCPTTGCEGVPVKRGFFYTTVSAYQRYRCGDCGKWTRGGKRERGVDLRGVA